MVILNNALNDAINRFIDSVKDAEEADPIFAEAVNFFDEKPVMFFIYEKDHLSLFVIKYMATFIGSDVTFKNNEGETKHRKVSIGFSDNLVKYLKGFPLANANDKINFLNIPGWQWATLRREKRCYADSNAYEEEDEEYELHTYEYYVIEGDKISTAEWSDYVGIAVTSTDFPVVGQVYSHFYYDQTALKIEKDLFQTWEKYHRLHKYWAEQQKKTMIMPAEEAEGVQEQN